jgi:hypothetical protein
MAIILENINGAMPLQFILSVYGTKENRNVNQGYVEYIPIEDGKPADPRPLSIENLDTLHNYLINRKSGSTQLYGAIPRQLLFMKPELGYYVWTVPAMKRRAYFDGKPNRFVHYPNMLFVADGTDLSLFCYKGKLTDKTEIYSAPLWNVDHKGLLCLGNVKLNNVKKASTYAELLQAWEDVLFLSRYSHGYGHIEKLFIDAIKMKRMPWKLIKKHCSKRKLKSFLS